MVAPICNAVIMRYPIKHNGEPDKNGMTKLIQMPPCMVKASNMGRRAFLNIKNKMIRINARVKRMIFMLSCGKYSDMSWHTTVSPVK